MRDNRKGKNIGVLTAKSKQQKPTTRKLINFSADSRILISRINKKGCEFPHSPLFSNAILWTGLQPLLTEDFQVFIVDVAVAVEVAICVTAGRDIYEPVEGKDGIVFELN